MRPPAKSLVALVVAASFVALSSPPSAADVTTTFVVTDGTFDTPATGPIALGGGGCGGPPGTVTLDWTAVGTPTTWTTTVAAVDVHVPFLVGGITYLLTLTSTGSTSDGTVDAAPGHAMTQDLSVEGTIERVLWGCLPIAVTCTFQVDLLGLAGAASGPFPSLAAVLGGSGPVTAGSPCPAPFTTLGGSTATLTDLTLSNTPVPNPFGVTGGTFATPTTGSIPLAGWVCGTTSSSVVNDVSSWSGSVWDTRMTTATISLVDVWFTGATYYLSLSATGPPSANGGIYDQGSSITYQDLLLGGTIRNSPGLCTPGIEYCSFEIQLSGLSGSLTSGSFGRGTFSAGSVLEYSGSGTLDVTGPCYDPLDTIDGEAVTITDLQLTRL